MYHILPSLYQHQCEQQILIEKEKKTRQHSNTIFRYSVKVVEDHLVSLQLQTSKTDVYVKLSVLDNEEELISSVGKGHVVLPAFIFQKDAGAEPGRAGSRACE